MINKLPFTVIGGYLGAGKTTLLNHLLTHAEGLRLAVLVNDFGSVNIDVELIRSHEGDTLNLANGCMCCSLVNGFATAIEQIRRRSNDFDHMIIEASGVSDPQKIAQYGQMYQLPLDGILVVADAEQVKTQAQNKYVGDTVIRQFAQADLIVLNKADLVSLADLANLRTWLATLAPRTPVIDSVRSQVPLEVLLGVHESHRHEDHSSESCQEFHGHHSDDHHIDKFETWTIARSLPITRKVLDRFAPSLGEDIYRAKGFVFLQDDPNHRYIYQQVASRWSLETDGAWGNEPRRTQLVVIGRKGATRIEAIDALLENDVLSVCSSIDLLCKSSLAPLAPQFWGGQD
jgi:G3E family GTPase